MKNPIANVVLFFLLVLKGGDAFFQGNSHRPCSPPVAAAAQRGAGESARSGDNMASISGGGGDGGGGIYTNKPLLRGEFHRIGALLYPPLLGLPLFLRSMPQRHHVATLLFSLAVEGILVISATLHTFPWKRASWHQVARKADFAMIFVGIALLYSSLGKLLLGTASPLFTRVVEPLVWACAAIGVLTKCCIPDAPPWLNAGTFLMQGWAVGPLIPLLFHTASIPEAVMLVFGGISITLGAAAYSLQWPKWNKIALIFGPHEIFHVGTLFMFVSFWCTMWMRVVR
jgi:hemolysin III